MRPRLVPLLALLLLASVHCGEDTGGTSGASGPAAAGASAAAGSGGSVAGAGGASAGAPGAGGDPFGGGGVSAGGAGPGGAGGKGGGAGGGGAWTPPTDCVLPATAKMTYYMSVPQAIFAQLTYLGPQACRVEAGTGLPGALLVFGTYDNLSLPSVETVGDWVFESVSAGMVLDTKTTARPLPDATPFTMVIRDTKTGESLKIDARFDEPSVTVLSIGAP